MRTTVRLDPALLRSAKQRAAQSGRTLTALIEDGLRQLLARHEPLPRSHGPALPVSGSGGTLPGVDLDNTADLYEVMDGAP